MPHTLKTVFLSVVALVFILLTLFCFSPLHAEESQSKGILQLLERRYPDRLPQKVVYLEMHNQMDRTRCKAMLF